MLVIWILFSIGFLFIPCPCSKSLKERFDNHKERLNGLYGELKFNDNIYVKLEPILFMAKRIFFVYCIFWLKNPSVGIPLTIIATTVNLCFFLHVRPYVDKVVNNFEIFNEIVTSYFLMLLLALLNDYRLSHNMDNITTTWMVIGVLWVYIMVHMSYQIKD
jgi:hypothetical protein